MDVTRLLLKIMFTGLHSKCMVHNKKFHLHDESNNNNNI